MTALQQQEKGTMNKNLHFMVMRSAFAIRDMLRPRSRILAEVPIMRGSRLLDYGCGTGSYTMPVAVLVGPEGIVYALDVNPLAIKRVRELALREGRSNITTILSDCDTGLEDNSIDMVLLYDILHAVRDPVCVLNELHRVLKPGGTLSFSDHHLKNEEILLRVTAGGLFAFEGRGTYTYRFTKSPRAGQSTVG